MDESRRQLLKFGNCFILDLKGNRQSSHYHGTPSPNGFNLQLLVATRPPVKSRTTKLLEDRMISSLGQDGLTIEWGLHPPATECQHNWISESTLLIKPFQVCAEGALVHYSASAPPSSAHYSSAEQRPAQAESRRQSQTDCCVLVGTCVNPVQGVSVSCPVQWNRANWKLWKCDLVTKTHPVKWNQYQWGRWTGLLKSLQPPPAMEATFIHWDVSAQHWSCICTGKTSFESLMESGTILTPGWSTTYLLMLTAVQAA